MAAALRRHADRLAVAQWCRAATTCATPPPLLAHETATAGDPDAGPTTHALLAHGLLGSARNWRSFARALATRASAAAGGAPVAVTAVDLRCHGGSGPTAGGAAAARPPPHTVEAAAADVLTTSAALFNGRTPHALIGHSLGGKIVLEAARQALVSAHDLPASVWVLDSPLSARRRPPPPAPRPPTTAGILAALAGVRTPVPSRADAARRLEAEGVPPAVAAWLTSSLVPARDGEAAGNDADSKGFVWSFDLAGAASLFESYASTSAWPLLHHPPPGLHVHVVVGGASDRWSRAELDRLDAAAAAAPAAAAAAATTAGGAAPGALSVHTLPGAGHWVHVDAPGGLLDLLAPDLGAIARRVSGG